MHKFAVLIFITFLLTLMGCENRSKVKGIAWHVSNGNHQSLLLIPTLHLVPKDTHNLPEFIRKALIDSSVIAFEFDFGDQELLSDLAECRKLAASRDISEPISIEWRIKARALMDRAGLETIDPAPTYATLAEQLTAISLHLSGDVLAPGIDQMAHKLARNYGKKIVSLERPCDQIDSSIGALKVWNQESIHEKFEQLRLGEPLRTIKLLAEAWSEGEFHKMEEVSRDFSHKWPFDAKATTALVDSRNSSLAKAIIKTMTTTEGKAVVFIGALHFMGDRSILQLLVKEGYSIHQQSNEKLK